MIVIAANGGGRMTLNPFDTRDGISAVIDEVAEEQAGVERFFDGEQSWPVRVDIGKHENLHVPRIRMRKESAQTRCRWSIKSYC